MREQHLHRGLLNLSGRALSVLRQRGRHLLRQPQLHRDGNGLYRQWHNGDLHFMRWPGRSVLSRHGLRHRLLRKQPVHGCWWNLPDRGWHLYKRRLRNLRRCWRSLLRRQCLHRGRRGLFRPRWNLPSLRRRGQALLRGQHLRGCRHSLRGRGGRSGRNLPSLRRRWPAVLREQDLHGGWDRLHGRGWRQ